MPGKTRTAPRKTPIQARSKATVDAILAATARLLVKHGFDRTSTNQIAEAAGVSVGSLYQYFPSKESLVAALLRRHQDEMMAGVMSEIERVRDLPLADAVRAMIQLVLRAHAVDPDLHRVLMEQVPRFGRPQKRYEFERAMLAAITAYLDSRRDELGVADVELSAFLVAAAVESVTHGAMLHHPERLHDGRLLDELTAMVLGYLTAPYRLSLPSSASAGTAVSSAS
jgi:AcrR family transcriptional regulator